MQAVFHKHSHTHTHTHTRMNTNTHTWAHSSYQSRYSGDRGITLTWRNNLAFHWVITVDGAIHESDVHARADHAAERGVPFPAPWKSELSLGVAEPVVDVDALARAAILRAQEELSLSDASNLDCRQFSKTFAQTDTHTHTHTHEHKYAYLGTFIIPI